MNQAQDTITAQHYFLFPAGERDTIHPFLQQNFAGDTATTAVQTSRQPGQLRNMNSNDWITIILILAFALYAWVRFYHARRMGQIQKAILARHLSNHMIKEGNLFRERISLPLQAMALLSLSFFTFLTLEHFSFLESISKKGIEGYARLLLIVVMLWFLKLVAVRIAGFLFKTNTSAYIYNLNALVYLTAAGILLLPFNVITAYIYSDYLIYLGLISLGLLYLLWIIRGISVGLDENRFSGFHLFLYLCTFEILPVLILLKLIFESN